MRAEAITHLNEHAVALGVDRKRTWRRRDRVRVAAAMAALAGLRGPHRPVASAHAEAEIVGEAIRQHEFSLNAAPRAFLREISDRLPQPMRVQTAEMGVRQVRQIAIDPETIP